MLRTLSAVVFGLTVVTLTSVAAQQKSPGAGPIIVLETARGTIEFETCRSNERI